MPTKFVVRSAERAGISVDAAEHKWHEAKKAIKKGKRRGHWYWGKVVNTFKKMMGFSEGVTFKDFMLLESDQGQYKNDTAERGMVKKFVELANSNGLMKGGKTEENLEKAYDFLESDWGGAIWDRYYELFTSMHPDFEGPFYKPRYTAFKREAMLSMRKWKNGTPFAGSSIGRMHEEESDDMPDVIMLEKGYYLEAETRSEFRVVYHIKRMMDDEYDDNWMCIAHRGRDGSSWIVRQPIGGVQLNHDVRRDDVFNAKLFKAHVLEVLRKEHVLVEGQLVEGREKTLPQIDRQLPDTIMLKNGYYLEKFPGGSKKIRYRLHRLMGDDDVLGNLFIVKHVVMDEPVYRWQLHGPSKPGLLGTGPVATETHDADFAAHQDLTKFTKEFVSWHLSDPKLNLEETLHRPAS